MILRNNPAVTVTLPKIIADAIDAQIAATGKGRSLVVTDLIKHGLRYMVTSSFEVTSLTPLVINGQAWEGDFTGIVRVYLPSNTPVLAVDLSLHGETFEVFTARLVKYATTIWE